jgi:hypothetical protein
MAKRAKRRRRERKRERRETTPRSLLRVPLPASSQGAPPTEARPRGPLADDSQGDQLANELRDDDDGGAPVREPRRPKPNAPMESAAAVEPPSVAESTEAVASDS